MSWTVIVLFLLGLVLLVIGAEALVRGASRLAAAMGISPLVIGLTVVAFGTSAPEMAVSIQSALTGQGGADIAIGNVVGSNICNILLVLGLSAAIAPLLVAQQLVRVEVPIMIGCSFLIPLLGRDGNLGRWDGLLLFTGIITYTVFAIRQGRKEGAAIQAEYAKEFGQKPATTGGLFLQVVFIFAGLGMLVLGSRWLVDGAIALARAFGVDELVIGLTIVALGTSLPELATSIMASIRGERDIAVGNLIGSNLFNLLAVLGPAALLTPSGINISPAAMNFDIPVMIAVAVACLPIFFTGYRIARWEGFLFLAFYIAYTFYLFLAATDHAAAGPFSQVMLFFVLPLTAITLMVTVFRQLRSGAPGKN